MPYTGSMTASAAAAAFATTARCSGERRTTKRQAWTLAPDGAHVAASRHRPRTASSTGSSVSRRIVRAVAMTSQMSLLAAGIAPPRRSSLLVDASGLHDERHPLHGGDVVEGVAGDADHVGEHARGDASEV